MTRSGTFGTVGAMIGFFIALIACAMAQWLRTNSALVGFDIPVRTLIPFSGGLQHLAALTFKGRFITQMALLNAAIYGVVGFIAGIVLQLSKPKAPQDQPW